MSVLAIPSEYTRNGNTNHRKVLASIPDAEVFSYGTAGFRYNADKLPFIVFRCAYLAGLRARQLNSSIGIMITASHNPMPDNGVKLVDPNGDMLNEQWEKYATQLVNTTDADFESAVRKLEQELGLPESSPNAKVLCGHDTRNSAAHLRAAARAGVELCNVKYVDELLVTTPMLHYRVKASNYPEFAPNGYFKDISQAFIELFAKTREPRTSRYQKGVSIDCANGVGGPRFVDMARLVTGKHLHVDLRNNQYPESLNEGCGADFVKIAQKMPSEFYYTDMKCASFDGDADRLVYFRPKSQTQIELFDGDKIAVLIATYIRDQLENVADHGLSMGIVQTAYANGSSTRYIREKLGIEPVIVPTGVKHLHHAATRFDIGVYFEANGHGTVVFSEKFDRIVRNGDPSLPESLQRLALFSRVINETVGDAFADLLAVETALRHFGWSMDDWAKNLYEDVPNVQIKVPVVDRSVFETTNAEQTLVKPDGLQKVIDEEVAKYRHSRAFIRPSGTENIVRVYAEADTVENTQKLGKSLEEAVLGLTAV